MMIHFLLLFIEKYFVEGFLYVNNRVNDDLMRYQKYFGPIMAIIRACEHIIESTLFETICVL